MILLHPEIRSLARLCGDGDCRTATSGILVVEKLGGYACTATNSKVLVTVESPNAGDDVPLPSADFAEAAFAILPKDVVVAACEAAASSPRRLVAVQLGDSVSRMEVSSPDRVVKFEAANVQGRYPDIAAILPKSKPDLVVRFNPELLADLLLAVAAQIGQDDDTYPEVVCEFRNGLPVLVRGVCPKTGAKITGLIMPLA